MLPSPSAISSLRSQEMPSFFVIVILVGLLVGAAAEEEAGGSEEGFERNDVLGVRIV